MEGDESRFQLEWAGLEARRAVAQRVIDLPEPHLLDALSVVESLVAQTRFLLLAPTLLGPKADPETRKSVFDRPLLRALPIVAHNADGQAVLTRHDLDGFLKLMELQAWLDGAPRKMSGARKRELERFFIESFPTPDPETAAPEGSEARADGDFRALLQVARTPAWDGRGPMESPPTIEWGNPIGQVSLPSPAP